MSSNRFLRISQLTSLIALGFAATACSSTSTAPDTSGLNGDAGGVGGNAALTGTYGTDAIKPVVAAYWIGQPSSADESGGGPFLYLFSTPVSCSDISKASGWAPSLPADTQALEMIVGVKSTGASASAAPHAAPNVAEVNYFGQSSTESRAVSGTVTLTSYVPSVAVEGTVDVAFPTGNVKGTFHATWCPGGHER